MQIQLQHDSVQVKKIPDSVNDPLIPAMEEHKGGLYLKHIVVRREIEFLTTVRAYAKKTKYDLFRVSNSQKIITFHLVPTIRLIGQSASRPNKSLGALINVVNTNLVLSKNRTLISWIIPAGSGDFGYEGDKIEVFANVYIADRSAKTLRK